jgi:hypothetical protein
VRRRSEVIGRVQGFRAEEETEGNGKILSAD